MTDEDKQALREKCQQINDNRGGDVEFYFDPDANLTPADETHIALCQLDRDWPLLWVSPELLSVEFLRVAESLFNKGIEIGHRSGASAKAREIRKALEVDEAIERSWGALGHG